MEYLNSIIKVEHFSLDPSALRSFLANYGSIDAFLPCIPDGTTPRQVFVRFNSAQAAQRAYNAQNSVRGLRVSTLSQDPCLLHQYLALCSLNLKSCDTTSVKKRQEYQSRKTPKARPNFEESNSSMNRKKEMPMATTKSQPQREGCNTATLPCTGSFAPKDSVNGRHVMPRTCASRSSDALDCQTASHIITSPAMFCMESKIELRVAGENFIYDLSKLEDNSKSIIELLKLASAERAHWMVVAAFYRRKGNALAAINLMMELIQVLERQGVNGDKMKPAYLMLSGCEADLAKDEKENSSAHYMNSRSWLQKVYGTFDDHSDNKTQNKDKSKHFTNDTKSLLRDVNICGIKRPNDVPREQRNRKRRRLCMNRKRVYN